MVLIFINENKMSNMTRSNRVNMVIIFPPQTWVLTPENIGRWSYTIKLTCVKKTRDQKSPQAYF